MHWSSVRLLFLLCKPCWYIFTVSSPFRLPIFIVGRICAGDCLLPIIMLISSRKEQRVRKEASSSIEMDEVLSIWKYSRGLWCARLDVFFVLQYADVFLKLWAHSKLRGSRCTHSYTCSEFSLRNTLSICCAQRWIQIDLSSASFAEALWGEKGCPSPPWIHHWQHFHHFCSPSLVKDSSAVAPTGLSGVLECVRSDNTISFKLTADFQRSNLTLVCLIYSGDVENPWSTCRLYMVSPKPEMEEPHSQYCSQEEVSVWRSLNWVWFWSLSALATLCTSQRKKILARWCVTWTELFRGLSGIRVDHNYLTFTRLVPVVTPGVNAALLLWGGGRCCNWQGKLATSTSTPKCFKSVIKSLNLKTLSAAQDGQGWRSVRGAFVLQLI